MDHVAIMTKGSGYIEKILDGVKTIESRWYVNKIAPWDKISSGEMIYFKYAGGPIVAKAEVEKVEQFDQLTLEKIHLILGEYDRARKIGFDPVKLENEDPEYYSKKHYCILIHLINPTKIEEFNIDKKGFGVSCAWMCVPDINKIKI